MQFLTEQTNLYSAWRDGKSMNVTVKEMNTFIAIWIYMGICVLPCYEDYWNSNTRVPQIAELMSVKRFRKIRACFHLVDNDLPANGDRLAKVRPLLDHIKRKCQELEQQENEFSVDESVCLYKGKKAGNLRQYNPKKPHKWGFKFFQLCGVSGISYDFLPYMGADTFNGIDLSEQEKEFGVGGQVVITLCKSISLPRLSVVCFDNYFTSIELLKYLDTAMGLLSIGTVRANRTSHCPLMEDKELQKKGRGSMDCKVTNNGTVACVKWVDNKIVTLASTMAGATPVSMVKRWDKKEGTRIEVPCPNVVQKYNGMMGGVDTLDMLLELYRLPTRAKRWYVPIIGYLVSLSLVNSWLLYVRDWKAVHGTKKRDVQTSKIFRIHVFNSLAATEKRRGRPSADSPMAVKIIKSPVAPRPLPAERQDNVDHWPGFAEKRGRCRNCSDGFTEVKCMKCDMLLCFRRNKNCFLQFHREP